MDTEIGFLLKKIHDGAMRLSNRSLRGVEITDSQFRVLAYLRANQNREVTQKELEQYLQVSHPTIVGILNRLEQKGMIRCAFDGSHKRNKCVYLTPKEEEIYARGEAFRKEFEAILVKDFTKEEEQLLRRLLEKVNENLNQEV